MAKCKTDCIERPLSLAFEKLGHLVGRHPCVFVILSIYVATVLGAGFLFLQERKANDIEQQFTPVSGPAKRERETVLQHFPAAQEFSPLRLATDGTYASLIITALTAENILTEAAFSEIIELDGRVKSTMTENTFEDICAKTNGRCTSNTILDMIGYNASKISLDITYPGENGQFLGSSVGGVQLKPGGSAVSSARAVRLFYFLDETKTKENSQWLQGFINFFSNYTNTNISVSYFTSLSRQKEFEANTDSVIPLFSITYFLAITISILSCLRCDCVRTKVCVSALGVVSAGLAVLSGFGLLLFCGMPFAMTVASAPFLILGIGVDDMFIMISSWQKTEVDKDVAIRLAETYREAGVSITITTLTDVLSFYIGLLTPFRSVQSFCMYTGTALLFCFVFNIVFFGACLALNGRRERENRHWLTCRSVPEPSAEASACCAGGDYNKNTRKEHDMPMESFFKNYYGPFLTRVWVKALVCLIYAGYLAVSVYGCLQMQEGLDLKHLAVDGSYVADYYDKEDEFFSKYGPNVMLVVTGADFPYWNETARKSLDLCLGNFQNLTMTDAGNSVSWLQEYLKFGLSASINLNNETQFKSHLTDFLNISGFNQDVNFTKDKIHASRMFIQTVNISTAIDEKNMLNAFRETADDCKNLKTPVDLIVYHPAFIYFDQYNVIVSNTVQNILVATCAMLVVSLLLIPSPLCSLCVTLAIASVIAGVSGFMALWGVSLDSVSMINLVICIGFSVDFSAHISYAFVSSEQSSADGRAVDALGKLGYPILQGAVSTIAGVVVLAAAHSYIFRTFFKIMFLVILFGAVHGLAFIPVLLTFLGICSNSRVKNEEAEPERRAAGAERAEEIPRAAAQQLYLYADPDCY